ncbi:MAG: LPP20 family lipoprotein [Pseudohongiellaceae bacterium]
MFMHRLCRAVCAGLLIAGLLNCSAVTTRTELGVDQDCISVGLLNCSRAAGTQQASSAGSVINLINQSQRITATGYAVIEIQNSEVAAQRRLLAIRASKLDAYRTLAEQVYGQYLDATTTVADLVVVSDSFRARVEGVIYGARLESIKPVGQDSYEVTLSLGQDVVNDLRLLYLEYISAGTA